MQADRKIIKNKRKDKKIVDLKSYQVVLTYLGSAVTEMVPPAIKNKYPKGTHLSKVEDYFPGWWVENLFVKKDN